MFGFLKKKLKKNIEELSEELEDKLEVVETRAEELQEHVKEKKSFIKKFFSKHKTDSDVSETSVQEDKNTEEIIKDNSLIDDKVTETTKPFNIDKTDNKVGTHNIIDSKKSDLNSGIEPDSLSKEIDLKEHEDKLTVTESDKSNTKVSAKIKSNNEDFNPVNKKSGFFKKFTQNLTKIKINEDLFEELFWNMELMFLENNIALEVIDKIKQDLFNDLKEKKFTRNTLKKVIIDSLKESLKEVLSFESFDLIEMIKSGSKPFKIVLIGVNGSGKTTTLAKLVYLFNKHNLKSVISASDTFRAAAIQQLEEHADKLGVKIIKHDYGADPAAVAFDAIKHAESKGIDVVLIDTAGRLHSNTNLMQELNKIVRVVKPDLKIFVGESITGNDCVEQAKEFNDAVGIDGIILTKSDVDEKGGAAISISYVTKKPILFIANGQNYADLKRFDPDFLLKQLFE